MFMKAAKHGELDTMRGVSANVMCGQEGFYGTSAFQVILDLDEMAILGDATIVKEAEAGDILDIINQSSVGDVCSIENITRTQNLDLIKRVDMGQMDEYNPFA